MLAGLEHSGSRRSLGDEASSSQTHSTNGHFECIACVLCMRRVASMTRGAYDLPPLDALVAFESAARHLSFTRAAHEIVADAVGDQPADPGARVAPRRRAVPPPAPRDRPHRGRPHPAARGRRCAGAARPRDARDQARRAGQDRDRHDHGGLRRPLADSAPGEVRRRPPGVDVRISTGNEVVNLERDGVDVAVRYRSVDAALPAGAVPLFGETVFPVCSPKPARVEAGAARRACRSRAPHPAGHGGRRRQRAHGLGRCGCTRSASPT